MRRFLFNSDSDAGLPPAAKTVVSGETDLDKAKPTPTPPPAPAPETKPTPAPVVKDEKWLDTEISHTEDKLRQLREQKSASSPAPAKKSVRVVSSLAIFGRNESED